MAYYSDFLVIGSGIAGLSFALEASRHGSVAILTKLAPDETATSHAQGGIASVLAADDSYEAHVNDTLNAGAGLCHRDVVDLCVRSGPSAIRRLINLGVEFTMDEDGHSYDLGREGGHTRRRILHSDDLTGAEIQRALLATLAITNDIVIHQDHIAIDLITSGRYCPTAQNRCIGAYAIDRNTNRVKTFLSRVVVLATGGAGKVYLYTSNPDVASGDGIAMAYRAGAEIANLEFIQFHPTCLFHPETKSFLISEALRGEGGILRRLDGSPLMDGLHPMGSLAPRDVVARSIDLELKRTGADCVHLDMTHLPREFLERRFPNIHRSCLEHGIDMASAPIPVVPAAHYSCGGVRVDISGESSLPGLFAIGETACTGLHGANRLASNSLLEAAVFSVRAAERAVDYLSLQPPDIQAVPDWDPGDATDSDETVVVTQNWDEIRRTMWNYVGIVRSDKRLARARRRIDMIQDEIRQYYWDFIITPDLIELRNIATVASLIIESASFRRESRGLHYNIDCSDRDDFRWDSDTIIRRDPSTKMAAIRSEPLPR